MRGFRFRRVACAAAFAGICAVAGPRAQSDRSGRTDADWPTYNRDLAGTRYSPLKQITTGNVATLTRAWSYPLGRDKTAGSLSGGSEFTPIIVNGVMYVAASDRIVALESDTGRETWRHHVKDGVPSRRGVAYWPGDSTNPARIFFTVERRLVALAARTGEPVAGFGVNGEIDMIAPYNSAPTVYKNLLIVGTNGSPAAYARSTRAAARRPGSSTRWRSLAIPPTRRGKPTVGRIGPGPTAGRSRRRSTSNAGCCTSPSKHPGRTTTGEAIAGATISTATPSWRSTRIPAS